MFWLILLGAIVLWLVLRAKAQAERDEEDRRQRIAAMEEAERRQRTEAAQREKLRQKDIKESEKVLAFPELPTLKEWPIVLKPGEVLHYQAWATMVNQSGITHKTVDTGHIYVGNRRLFFMGDKQTITIDLSKILAIDHPFHGAIEIMREGRQKNALFTVNMPYTLGAYILRAQALDAAASLEKPKRTRSRTVQIDAVAEGEEQNPVQ